MLSVAIWIIYGLNYPLFYLHLFETLGGLGIWTAVSLLFLMFVSLGAVEFVVVLLSRWSWCIHTTSVGYIRGPLSVGPVV